MGSLLPENIDEALVQALQVLDFDDKKIKFIKKNPYQSNYPHLARRILQIFFEQPKLRINNEGEQLRRILFICLSHMNEQAGEKEFNTFLRELFQTPVMQELKDFYTSDLPSASHHKGRAWLKPKPSAPEEAPKKEQKNPVKKRLSGG